jgi:hypothetical protein
MVTVSIVRFFVLMVSVLSLRSLSVVHFEKIESAPLLLAGPRVG